MLAMGIASLSFGCGGSDNEGLVAEVMRAPVTERQVTAWQGAFSPAGGDEGQAIVTSGSPSATVETIGFLIRSLWLEKEASRRAIKLTKVELRRALAERIKPFESAQDLTRYLAGSGMSRRQFRARVRRDALFGKLMQSLYPPDRSISRIELARFYRRHISEFDEPSTRDLRAVITGSRSAAMGARTAIEAGQSWDHVVRKFTVDASRRTGGRMSIDTRNVIRTLRTAVFSAPLRQLVGPIDVKGSWWIFRVDRHRPARRLSLAEAAPRIRISIRSTREQLAADRLIAYLTRRYRPHTVCHNGYTAPECRNGKLPSVPAPSKPKR